jgi:glycosyltransferase involved in cell wall biosynthesis
MSGEFSNRMDFLFIGNFLHEPNWDAVQYLKSDVWPIIRAKLPDAKVHVYGAYPSQKVLALNSIKEGFIIEGRAADVNDVMKKARVNLAPLRFGAGLKGKLIDSMVCGAEGMHNGLDWCGAIADGANELANAAVELYTKEITWVKAQKQGFRIIKHNFTGSFYGEALIHRIDTIQKELEEHRKGNFIGQILMHHTLQSTKYMSRWIEEKNK